MCLITSNPGLCKLTIRNNDNLAESPALTLYDMLRRCSRLQKLEMLRFGLVKSADPAVVLPPINTLTDIAINCDTALCYTSFFDNHFGDLADVAPNLETLSIDDALELTAAL